MPTAIAATNSNGCGIDLFIMNNLSIAPVDRPILCGVISLACVVALFIGREATAQTSDQPSPAAPSTVQTQPKGAGTPQGQQAQGAADSNETQEGERLISLVLLLSSPRKPSHELIAHAVSEGLGTKISTDAVVSKLPYHLVNVGDDKFIINDIAQPYFEQSAKVADEIKNPNLSRAVQDHRAWISVDWVSADQQTDLHKVYQMIGKMVSHLSGQDTLAVYSPDMDQFALWTPTLRQGLESDDPLAVFEPAQSDQPAQAAPGSPTATASP